MIRVVPQALLPGVGLGQRHLRLGAAGEPQVGQGCLVDREDRAGAAVLRAHVADGGPVGHRHLGHAGAEELHERADHPDRPQQLGDGQHQVGGGGALGQLAGQPHPDHLRGGDQAPVLVAQQVLQQHLQAVRQPGHPSMAFTRKIR
jgi:hypothetical protein